MKNKKLIIFLIVLLSLIVISLSIFVFIGIKSDFKFKFYNKVSNNLVVDKIYEMDLKELKVNADASDIDIKYSNDNKISINIYGKKSQIDVQNNDGKLIISSKSEKCFGFCWNLEKSKIEIYLPKEYENNINVKNNLGDINIDNFINTNIIVEENLGNVFVKGGKDIIASIDKGNIEITKAINLTAQSDYGNIKIQDVDNINAELNLGNIIIKNVMQSLNITNDCGDVIINKINLEKDSKIINNLGNIKIGKTNEIYIDAENEIGKIKINNNYKQSNVTLKLINDCGNVIVDN